MSSNGSVPANIEYLRRCCACGQMHARPGRYCSFECIVLLAEFVEFHALRSLLKLSRWTGGKSQRQLQTEYYAQQIRDAIRQLSVTSDLLAEALIEIVAEMEVEAAAS